MIYDYDIIILGAGPAGLAVASELSSKYKVLVVDKKPSAPYMHRSWFCPNLFVEDKPELKPFLYPGIKRFILRTFDGGDLTDPEIFIHDAQLEYSYICGEQLLAYFDTKINSNEGSKTIYNAAYESHFINQDGVVFTYHSPDEIKTSEVKLCTVNAKLLINAAGHRSPIQHHWEEEPMWWSVYCPEVSHPFDIAEINHDMKPRDYLLWAQFSEENIDSEASCDEGRLIFEYEMLSQNPYIEDVHPRSTPMIFYIKDEKVSYEYMKNKYESLLSKNSYVRDRFSSATVEKMNWGWYPSTGLDQKRALDRLSFIGDAGCWTSACGWGASFILKHYKVYAEKLSHLLDKNDLSADGLAEIMNFSKPYQFQILMDQLMIRFLAACPPKTMNGFIRTFNQIPFLYCEKLFTLTLEADEFGPLLKAMLKEIGLKPLIKALRSRDIPLLLKVLIDYIQILSKEECRELINVLHSSSDQDKEKYGFFHWINEFEKHFFRRNSESIE
jgi:hypothetical protein